MHIRFSFSSRLNSALATTLLSFFRIKTASSLGMLSTALNQSRKPGENHNKPVFPTGVCHVPFADAFSIIGGVADVKVDFYVVTHTSFAELVLQLSRELIRSLINIPIAAMEKM